MSENGPKMEEAILKLCDTDSAPGDQIKQMLDIQRNQLTSYHLNIEIVSQSFINHPTTQPSLEFGWKFRHFA